MTKEHRLEACATQNPPYPPLEMGGNLSAGEVGALGPRLKPAPNPLKGLGVGF
jgi:hypothetical protein